MTDPIISTKLEQTGEIFGTADAVWVHGYPRFELGAWKWNEGLPCLCADCKILIPPILFKFSHSIIDWTALSWNIFWIFETFLEGSVDHIIYRNYMVNLHFFNHCNLATSLSVYAVHPDWVHSCAVAPGTHLTGYMYTQMSALHAHPNVCTSYNPNFFVSGIPSCSTWRLAVLERKTWSIQRGGGGINLK